MANSANDLQSQLDKALQEAELNRLQIGQILDELNHLQELNRQYAQQLDAYGIESMRAQNLISIILELLEQRAALGGARGSSKPLAQPPA
jgi:hypothetical protein